MPPRFILNFDRQDVRQGSKWTGHWRIVESVHPLADIVASAYQPKRALSSNWAGLFALH